MRVVTNSLLRHFSGAVIDSNSKIGLSRWAIILILTYNLTIVSNVILNDRETTFWDTRLYYITYIIFLHHQTGQKKSRTSDENCWAIRTTFDKCNIAVQASASTLSAHSTNRLRIGPSTKYSSVETQTKEAKKKKVVQWSQINENKKREKKKSCPFI